MFVETTSPEIFSDELAADATWVESDLESIVSKTFNFSMSATETIPSEDDNAGDNSEVIGKADTDSKNKDIINKMKNKQELLNSEKVERVNKKHDDMNMKHYPMLQTGVKRMEKKFRDQSTTRKN